MERSLKGWFLKYVKKNCLTIKIVCESLDPPNLPWNITFWAGGKGEEGIYYNKMQRMTQGKYSQVSLLLQRTGGGGGIWESKRRTITNYFELG